LTADCVKYVLNVFENNQKYNNYMKHRFPPDEIYIHTIIQNSPFSEKVSKDIIVRRSGEETLLNLTYFEYPVYVTVFTDRNDYQWLKNTGCLFVRKVNSSSIDLLDELDKHILK
jgi:capsule polysaccharide modification protein KpsS